jgi:hypothetical protein
MIKVFEYAKRISLIPELSVQLRTIFPDLSIGGATKLVHESLADLKHGFRLFSLIFMALQARFYQENQL